MQSIRSRLLVALVVGGGALVGTLFIGLDIAVDRELYSRFDAALATRARALGEMVSARTLNSVTGEERWPEYAASAHQDFYQLWNSEGSTIARSRSSQGRDLERPPNLVAATPMVYDVVLPDGHRGRAAAVATRRSDHAEPLLLVVASEREALDALEARLHLSLVVGALTMIVAAAVGAVVTVQRALAPLLAFSRSIAARASEPDNARAAEAPLPTELVPIAATLNRAFDEISDALAREQRFARRAAHELRTPLAELQVIAERMQAVARSGNDDDAHAVLRAVAGMTRSIEGLLTLARCEAGIEKPVPEPFNLVTVVQRQLELLRAELDARKLRLVSMLPGELWVMSDRALLERIIANLVANAVTHAATGSQVSVDLRVTGASAELVVSNLAGSVDAARLSAAISGELADVVSYRQDLHAGLGLLLARSLAEQLGLRLAYEIRGATVTMRLQGPDLLVA